MRVATALGAALAAQELLFFFEQPQTHATRAELSRAFSVCGWVLSESQEASTYDECAGCDELRGPPVVRLLSANGKPSLGLRASAERARTIDATAARRLLRVRAAERQLVGSVVLATAHYPGLLGLNSPRF